MKIKIEHLALLIAVASFVGCSGSGNGNSETPFDTSEVKASPKIDASIVFYNIPSPLETFTLLKMSGSGFDKSLLNPANKITKYVSSFQKAMNLGTYSTDLSFCYLYKQNQDFSNYIKNINELTNTLGIDGSYGQEINNRLQANLSNLDSLMAIVSEAGVNANQYLKENQRDKETAIIAAGGWIEAMYIITSVADKSQNKDLFGMVGDQKIILKNLIKMLKQFESDPDVKMLLDDMKGIAVTYESIQATQSTVIAPDKDVISVGNNTSFEVSKDQLKSILEKVTALRNKITL